MDKIGVKMHNYSRKALLTLVFFIFFINLVRMFDWVACGIKAFTKHSLLCRLDPTTRSRNSSAMAEFYPKV